MNIERAIVNSRTSHLFWQRLLAAVLHSSAAQLSAALRISGRRPDNTNGQR